MKPVKKLIVILMVLALFASACSDDDAEEGTTSAATATTAASADVTNPGVLVHSLGGEPEGLDPAQVFAGGYGDRVIIQMYDFLLDLPPDSPEPVPMISTEVPSIENGLVSADGLVYTFPIREGVKFHDGTDLTAEDIEYSWDRVLTMDMPEGQAEVLNMIVEDFRAVDDYTFEVTLQQPAAWFLTAVVPSIPAAIVSKDSVEANGGVVAGEPNEWMLDHDAGSGPYKLVSWDRNIRLTFEKYDEYWGEPAKLDARFEVTPSESATVLGMSGGEYDIVEPTPQYLEELAGNEDVCPIAAGFLLEPLHLAFNLRIPEGALPDSDTIPEDFFWDKRVRQAFVATFDYEAMAEAGLAGFGEPATLIPPPMFGYSPDLPKQEQDLALAEQLFRETGYWDEGFEVSVIVEEANPTFLPVGLILKDALETLNPNFRVNVIQVAEAQFDEEHAKDPFEYAMWIKNADPFADPHFLFNRYWHPDGVWGTTLGYRNGYENPDAIADLIDRAAAETDLELRAQMYQDLVPMLLDDPMWIWAADEVNLQIVRCWVDDFVYNPLWIMPRWKYYNKG